MRTINRVPALMAVCWGVVLVIMLPSASLLKSPGGINEAWTALVGGEALLLVLCAWARSCKSPDLWSRILVVVAFAVAIDAGVDLGEVYRSQQVYDNMSHRSLHYVNRANEEARPDYVADMSRAFVDKIR